MSKFKRAGGLAAALAGAFALLLGGLTAPAWAGGSDSQTPYTVDRHGITLPSGDTFRAHGHVNIRWSNPDGSAGVHFDPNNGHPGGAWIGERFIPWSAFGVPKKACITWVQIDGYNQHFGEGGQKPVCLGKKPKPKPKPPVDDTETKKVTLCHATGSETNPYTAITVSVNAFLNAGHVDHEGDIWAEFTYTKHGEKITVPAQGDQSLLPDCEVPGPGEEEPGEEPGDEPGDGPGVVPPTFTNHSCTDVGSITLPAVEDGIYRLMFEENAGVWVGLPSGTFEAVKGLGVFPHDQAGEPIYGTLHVRLHQVSTWPNDPLGEWSFTFTEPEDCTASPGEEEEEDDGSDGGQTGDDESTGEETDEETGDEPGQGTDEETTDEETDDESRDEEPRNPDTGREPEREREVLFKYKRCDGVFERYVLWEYPADGGERVPVEHGDEKVRDLTDKEAERLGCVETPPPPKEEPKDEPREELAETGVNPLVAILAALGMTGTGAALLVARSRKRAGLR